MSRKSKTITLNKLVERLRNDLKDPTDPRKKKKDFVLLYAYNGTGKTRLSMEFKERGKRRRGIERDTLYFNAFTEDLFRWDNDLDGDSERVLRINKDSRFFVGLEELEMENRIRPFLHRYADFDFGIDYAEGTIRFSCNAIIKNKRTQEDENKKIDYIKVSRGEENIFIWCFFLAVAQLAIDGQEAYQWVEFLYIDDPISSIDDNNVITVASHLAQLLKAKDSKLKVVISSHHTLFFNVMCNEFKRTERSKQYFLSKDEASDAYTLRPTDNTPFFHHISMLTKLKQAADSGNLYAYHFNILRNILEKTATFHGFNNFAECVKQDRDDVDGAIRTRMINILSHGNYSLFEPKEMVEENKKHFRNILKSFMDRYAFNPTLFPEDKTQVSQSSQS